MRWILAAMLVLLPTTALAQWRRGPARGYRAYGAMWRGPSVYPQPMYGGWAIPPVTSTPNSIVYRGGPDPSIMAPNAWSNAQPRYIEPQLPVVETPPAAPRVNAGPEYISIRFSDQRTGIDRYAAGEGFVRMTHRHRHRHRRDGFASR